MESTKPSPGGLALLRHFPDLPYFAKDLNGDFTGANAGFIALIGYQSESQILGKNDFHVWPRFLAVNYVKDDARVMKTSEPVVNRIELVFRADRSTDWYATTKVPLFGTDGEIIGLEGVCRFLKKGDAPLEPTLKMAGVVEYIMSNYSQKIDIPSLAAMLSLSVKQFERRFKQEYRETPVRHILRIRLNAAQQLLATTDMHISRISQETGFYDSSHFSHQFMKYTGFSPKSFRQTFAPTTSGKISEV